ncbi:hypothetical protein SERLADRAFT_477024 [Serpula lacrymans var. lacrymans S7.9]|uniref:Uncharacterized protein n=1 Tax=Serpula lacrymans var. lacrymans (strain S7.9) TaxID=578457 RepID=F8P869_SERL9|nr:uncharacterized protein SERLADRAFT_477024 [Serpula lacrymans var. lacrymans S7.9]EGO20626.1 hypothetical protein SERLADRAFT_477024 [Serpula lacrymans var. lacrymans S7.9]
MARLVVPVRTCTCGFDAIELEAARQCQRQASLHRPKCFQLCGQRNNTNQITSKSQHV